MHVDLENVLLRDPTLTAGEILMSESQERMMAVVAADKIDAFMDVINKWDVEAAVIGEVTGDGRLTIDHYGERIVDVDPKTVAHDGPVYDRPYSRPAWQDDLQADTSDKLARSESSAALEEELRKIVLSPNGASKAWVTDQYDRYVRGNTALAQPDDAGVIRVVEESNRGVAIATDANGWYTKLDPYAGAQQALAEAYRNVCTVGARPMAVTDCLNFGNPEDPDAMWQLVTAMTGMADGCKVLGTPVTGGNVSLYNSSGTEKGQPDSSINPTPVVGMLGLIDDVTKAVPSGWNEQGLAVLLLGETNDELDGSAWAREVHSHLGGLPPKVDFEAEMALGRVLIAVAQAEVDGIRVVKAAHDISNGGLAAAVLESASRFGIGANIDLARVGFEGQDDTVRLFSESQARALVVVPEVAVSMVAAAAEAEGVACSRIGTTGGSMVTFTRSNESEPADFEESVAGAADRSVIALDLADLAEASRKVLPELFA